MRSNVTRLIAATCIAAASAAAIAAGEEQQGPKFLADDPVLVDADSAVDASAARRANLGGYADFVLNTFLSPGDRRAVGALNVNTLDEVPDSSWFTNRIGSREMTVDQIVRGPDRVDRLDASAWVIVEGKDTGRQAGFRAVRADDPDGDLFQIEFDPPGNPEMATGAEIIGTAIYHAIGYNVVDTYLIDLDPARLTIADSASITIGGSTRRFTRADLAAVLRRAARRPDGRYRATASRFAEGRNLGPFRYYGTRPDDPNDIYPHEHRRELRANRVFAAWLNHDDSRAVNSLDMLVGSEGRRSVKHYMFDFGSILGSGTNEQDHPWVGHEYIVQGREAWLTLASLGLWRRPFIGVSARDDMPAAGNFTADGFDAASWRPHYPNASFDNLQPEDAFWAARIVAAFTPEVLAAIVAKAEFSDPNVVDYMTGTLVRRRELVLRSWLDAVLPIVDPHIAPDRVLRFANAAVDAGITSPPDGYGVAWFRFDNIGRIHRWVGYSRASADGVAAVPADRLEGSQYIGVDIRASHREHAQWRNPVRIYFRAQPNGWTTVGIDRRPDIRDEQHASQ
jgi:hypothetical protein